MFGKMVRGHASIWDGGRSTETHTDVGRYRTWGSGEPGVSETQGDLRG